MHVHCTRKPHDKNTGPDRYIQRAMIFHGHLFKQLKMLPARFQQIGVIGFKLILTHIKIQMRASMKHQGFKDSDGSRIGLTREKVGPGK